MEVAVDLKNLCIRSQIPEQQLRLIRLPWQESSEAQGLQRKPLVGGVIFKGEEP